MEEFSPRAPANPMPVSPVDTDDLLRRTFAVEVELHATLRSTNDLAKLRAAERSRPLPLLILTDHQTAGRGRGANRWWTGQGSLAFSLLLEIDQLDLGRKQVPLVALAAAVAVAEAVRCRAPASEVGLHWPNDVYADGRKISGVLVEVLPDRRCVVGVGVNTNNSLSEAPPQLMQSATTLFELTGTRHDHAEMVVSILARLEELLRSVTDCPDAVGRRANALCLQHRHLLTVELGGRSLSGCCAGIDVDGALLLDTPAGRQKVYSGTLRPSPCLLVSENGADG